MELLEVGPLQPFIWILVPSLIKIFVVAIMEKIVGDRAMYFNGENKKVTYDSNKGNDNNNNNSNEQSKDADNDLAITQMKELKENVKTLHATYQDILNVCNPLLSKDTENNCDALLEQNTNTVPP